MHRAILIASSFAVVLFAAACGAEGVVGPAPVTVVGGPNDGGKGLYVDDPDGNGVEIIQLARPWPSVTGLQAARTP